MGQIAGLGGGEKRQRDDAHCLLRVVAAVAEAQIAGAEDLELAKHRVDRRRPEARQQHVEQRHPEEPHQKAENGELNIGMTTL